MPGLYKFRSQFVLTSTVRIWTGLESSNLDSGTRKDILCRPLAIQLNLVAVLDRVWLLRNWCVHCVCI